MIEINRKLEIRWKDTRDSDNFKQANKEVITDFSYPRKIGSSVNAVKAITVLGAELRVLMPSILGIDPATQGSLDWEKAVQKYWNGLSVDVYVGGYPLETGFRFDIHDQSKTANIARLKETNKGLDLSTEELLGKYVMDSVPENEKYLYGMPINVANYLLWRYCLNYRDVANSPDVKKGSRVRFYIHDENAFLAKRKSNFATMQKAASLYIAMLPDTKKKLDIIWANGKSTKGMDSQDVDMYLDTLSRSQPERFIELANDSNLILRARIERYIAASILRRIDNTGIIVDAKDSSVVIGNSMEDAITYFVTESPVNKENISRFEITYKSMRNSNNVK
jgi:hypothetical protein